MIRIILTLLVLQSTRSAFAQEVDFSAELNLDSSKACICETGSNPENQKILFTMGCEVWLHRQKNCNAKKIVAAGSAYSEKNVPANTLKVDIGYVGHWDNSYHFVQYLEETIIPFMSHSGYSISIDNTACDAMKTPEAIANYVQTLRFAPNQTLFARGNQATSIGTWDVVLPSSDNFIAEISSELDHVIYPSCRKYLNRDCMGYVQENETGICSDNQGYPMTLTCCHVESPMDFPATKFSWQKRNKCGN